jgi:hypothetical protein
MRQLLRIAAMAGKAPVPIAAMAGKKHVFGNGDKVLDRGKSVRPAPPLDPVPPLPLALCVAAHPVRFAGVWKKFKYCEQCKLIIVERKKWENCWEEVKFCGDKCRAAAKRGPKMAPPADD